jgi:hypothetical protein
MRLGKIGLAMLLVIATAAPALAAGKPPIQERFEAETVEEPHQFILEECGVEVRAEFHFQGTFTLYPDMSSRTHTNISGRFVSSETGELLLVERNSVNLFHEPVVEVIDEEAGTLTLMFEDTLRGATFKWRVPGEGVVHLEAGTATFRATLVIDLATFELISSDEEITDVHGPHPTLTESEILEVLCAAMQG